MLKLIWPYGRNKKQPAMSTTQNKDSMSIRHLRWTTIIEICKKLDIENTRGNDFRALAAAVGMEPADISLLSKTDQPTAEIFKWWEPREDATIQNLRTIFQDIDRNDAHEILNKDPNVNFMSGSGPPEEKYQIWSLMSTSHDQYLKLPPPNTSSYAKADGSSDDPSSITMDIKHAIEKGVVQWYNISIQSNNETLYLTKDGPEIVFQQGSGVADNEIWLPEYMAAPNDPFYAIKSYGTPALYLSSDGAGNLKLKSSNSTKYPPPDMNPYIDPALLFRMVESTS